MRKFWEHIAGQIGEVGEGGIEAPHNNTEDCGDAGSVDGNTAGLNTQPPGEEEVDADLVPEALPINQAYQQFIAGTEGGSVGVGAGIMPVDARNGFNELRRYVMLFQARI